MIAFARQTCAKVTTAPKKVRIGREERSQK